MKKYRKILFLLFALVISIILLAGCNSKEEESEEDYLHLYSKGIDENGFWKGIKALDYIKDFEYEGIAIPSEVYEVTEERLQYQIDTLMSGYIARNKITDRAIADGDTVNIDYEGKVDGVVFEGGSTMEVGVDVIIGKTNDERDAQDTLSFLDGFLEELIGHMPGETINIEVTFPDDYYEEQLRGKTAVFTTTINYIVEREELTDAFVAEHLSESDGWTTIEEMRAGMRAQIQKNLVRQYIMQYLATKVSTKSVPDSLIKYQEKILLNDYQELADYNGIELEEYLKTVEGFSGIEECMEEAQDSLIENATYTLVVQAVAEDVGISVTDEDIENYFSEHLWSSDVSTQTDYYGLPYVKQGVLGQKVVDYIAENAKLE